MNGKRSSEIKEFNESLKTAVRKSFSNTQQEMKDIIS